MSEYYVEQENVQMSQDGMEFFHFIYEHPKISVDPHIHNAVEILFITEGCFRVFVDHVEYMVQEGDVVLFRSNTIHRLYPLKHGRNTYYVLKLRPDFILNLSYQSRGVYYLLLLSLHINEEEKTVWSAEECIKNGISNSLKRLIKESEAGGCCSDIAVKICAAEILLAMLRDIASSRENEALWEIGNEGLMKRIYHAIEFINCHYMEQLTAEECSRHVFMSYSYFSRCFKKITGKSFKNYLCMTRLSHAEKALIATEKPISEIALECGFGSVSYFIALYKKQKGITPLAFREICRGME